MFSLRRVVSIFILLAIISKTIAQTANNNSTFDSTTVLKYVEQKGLILLPYGYNLAAVSKIPSMAPQVYYQAKNNRWIVTSKTYKTIKGGKYKNTNGGTKTITKTVVVDGYTKKIVSNTNKSTYSPNYE